MNDPIIEVSYSDFIRLNKKDGSMQFCNPGFASDERIKQFALDCGIKGTFYVKREWENKPITMEV